MCLDWDAQTIIWWSGLFSRHNDTICLLPLHNWYNVHLYLLHFRNALRFHKAHICHWTPVRKTILGCQLYFWVCKKYCPCSRIFSNAISKCLGLQLSFIFLLQCFVDNVNLHIWAQYLLPGRKPISAFFKGLPFELSIDVVPTKSFMSLLLTHFL